MHVIRHLRRRLADLRRDRSGLAMLEFAFTLPIVLGIGGYGIEVSNLALLNLKISQIALALADNASRVGVNASLSTQQLREVDVNDILQGVRQQGAGIKLTTLGRVTLSSLEFVKQGYDSAPVQRIHWQRCIGQMSGAGYDSNYGVATPLATAGTDTQQANAGLQKDNGIGDPGALITAPSGDAVMFVEINYQAKPLFGTLLMTPSRIHYIASFIVRDNRDFSRLFQVVTSPATPRSTCDKYAA